MRRSSNVVPFGKRSRQPVRRRAGGSRLLSYAVLALLGIGGVSLATFGDKAAPAPEATATSAQFTMCGRDRYTCVVDGDTIWWQGQNLRLESYDTPEPRDEICGGEREVALAHQASARLLELLNSNPFTIETFGTDRYGRTLATVHIAGQDVGDILIAEGLARRWPDGHEFWC